MEDFIRVNTIHEAHEFFGIEEPDHPLVSVYKHDELTQNPEYIGKPIILNFYQIVFKMCSPGSIGYGRNSYDFQEGSMMLVKPGQVIKMGKWKDNDAAGGWSLIFHPDLIRKSDLGKTIDNYTYFSYSVNEALHLSKNERKSITELVQKIKKEYDQNIDKHSQELIIANIEMILKYCNRYYDRQFYTRTNLNKDFVSKFESLLKNYYKEGKALDSGVPTVKYCGLELNMSPHYLSDMLRKETGRSAQEHIYTYLIELAKTRLLNSTEAISQIAYDLGFQYPQHFSKLFKKKTGITPNSFRKLN
jgi:AraC-like DNA-binding protein